MASLILNQEDPITIVITHQSFEIKNRIGEFC